MLRYKVDIKVKTRGETGLSLIEILLTIGLVGLVGAALIRLGTTALTASDAGRQRAVATQLADEALEAARAWRDGGGGDFFAAGDGLRAYEDNGSAPINSADFPATTCNPDEGALDLNSTCDVIVGDATFYRVIDFTYPDALRANLTAYVFWNQQGTWTKVVSSTVLTQWR